MIRAICLCVSVLSLAACAGDDRPAQRTGWAVPSDTGIGVAGTGMEIGFGRHFDGAVRAVTGLSGAAPVYSGLGCVAGLLTVRWQNGLEMHFRSGSFVGWEAPQNATLWATRPASDGDGVVCASA